MTKLNGKVAVVTGGASGMGKEIATLYGQEGAKVIVADFNFEGAETAAKEINDAGGSAQAISVNVTDLKQIEKMIDTAIDTFGDLNILVNNAGIMDGFEPVGEITDEKWDQIFDVNTKGVMRAMRKAVNYWVENDKEGTIVNTISTGGLNGAHAGVAYGASKHAVVALTKNTGWMYANKGIRVNGIAPGSIETNIGSSIKDVSELGMERAGATHALSPRVGQAGEVAEAALFLGSDASSFVNGTILTVDGGWTAGF